MFSKEIIIGFGHLFDTAALSNIQIVVHLILQPVLVISS